MKIKYLFFCSVLFLISCQDNSTKIESTDLQRADSLSIKLNSPELKSVNELLMKEPNSAELYDQRAKIYLKLAQFDEAVYDSQRAIKLDSTKENFYLTRNW